MENKKTAVELLIKRCNDSLDKEPDEPTQQEIGYSKALCHFIVLLEEAKQMEKEQIKKAFQHSMVAIVMGKILSPEEYYNQTYKQPNNER